MWRRKWAVIMHDFRNDRASAISTHRFRWLAVRACARARADMWMNRALALDGKTRYAWTVERRSRSRSFLP